MKIKQVTKYEVDGILFHAKEEAENYIKLGKLSAAMQKCNISWEWEDNIEEFFAQNEKLIKSYYE